MPNAAAPLVEFAEAHGQPSEGSTDVTISLTQTELASMIGVTRESINKQLRVLKDKGLVGVMSVPSHHWVRGETQG